MLNPVTGVLRHRRRDRERARCPEDRGRDWSGTATGEDTSSRRAGGGRNRSAVRASGWGTALPTPRLDSCPAELWGIRLLLFQTTEQWQFALAGPANESATSGGEPGARGPLR